MPELSQNAKCRRQRDFIVAAGKLDSIDYHRLLLIGVIMLIRQSVKKLPPTAKAALALVVILAGGVLITLSLRTGDWGIALVIMFILGWLVSEISRL